MATCKGCGAKIVWIKTTGNKSMPCNPNQVMYWERANAKDKVLTPNGMVLSCVFDGDIQKATGLGYIPHWATCPCADKFRRK